MNASQYIYCKSSTKRVLLVSEDPHLPKDLDSILQQINMPESVKTISWKELSLTVLHEFNPHLLVLDGLDFPYESSIRHIHLSKPVLPIICLYEGITAKEHIHLIELGIQKLIKRDTLRFCGQILYRSIHGYAIHAYYQKEMKTKEQIKKSIRGLKDIQAFWDQSTHLSDPESNEVLKEVGATLDYLHLLQAQLGKSPDDSH